MSHYPPHKRGCLGTTIKWAAIFFVAYVLMHWLSAGQDNIIEGPPETPDVVNCQQSCPIE